MTSRQSIGRSIFLTIFTALMTFTILTSPASVRADTCDANNKICPFSYEPKGVLCGIAGVGVTDCCKPGFPTNWFAYDVFCDSPAATQDPYSLSCPQGFSRDECNDEQRNSGFCCRNGGTTADDVANGITAVQALTQVSFVLCESVPAGEQRQACLDCATSGDPNGEVSRVWTALGCIETEGTSIVTAGVRIGLGVAGGVLLLTTLGAAFLLSTSQGDPKKTEEAQKMITAGIAGIFFIIFSVVILRTIGVDILRIPGF